jgi:hypothetical protein
MGAAGSGAYSVEEKERPINNVTRLCGEHKYMSEMLEGVLYVEEKTFRNDGPIGWGHARICHDWVWRWR